MLSTSIYTSPNPNLSHDYHTLITFQIKYGSDVISNFGYPIMDKQCLRDFIAGIPADDQDDEGFTITLNSEGMIKITICRDAEYQPTVFNLAHASCVDTFKQIMDIYTAVNAFDSDDYKDCDSYESSE